jgi:hypothetical protein
MAIIRAHSRYWRITLSVSISVLPCFRGEAFLR